VVRGPATHSPPWLERGVVEVTAAASITIPATGRVTVCRIVGNANIDTITATTHDSGRLVALRFSGTPTITLAGNLEMPAAIGPVTNKDSLLFACFNGVNWTLLSQSANV